MISYNEEYGEYRVHFNVSDRHQDNYTSEECKFFAPFTVGLALLGSFMGGAFLSEGCRFIGTDECSIPMLEGTAIGCAFGLMSFLIHHFNPTKNEDPEVPHGMERISETIKELLKYGADHKDENGGIIPEFISNLLKLISGMADKVEYTSPQQSLSKTR